VWKAIIDACRFAGFEFISAILQEQAVSSGTQGINKLNTLTGDFVYTFRKKVSEFTLDDTNFYHSNGEELIEEAVYSFLKSNGMSTTSEVYEFIIPIIINNNALLDKKGAVINLEKLLLQKFDYNAYKGEFKWEIKKKK
jgi:hypothetical protein